MRCGAAARRCCPRTSACLAAVIRSAKMWTLCFTNGVFDTACLTLRPKISASCLVLVVLVCAKCGSSGRWLPVLHIHALDHPQNRSSFLQTRRNAAFGAHHAVGARLSHNHMLETSIRGYVIENSAQTHLIATPHYCAWLIKPGCIR